jgi:gliding motility-associated-like protein
MYLVSQTDVTVIGTSTGSVTLAGGGGTPPYRYSKDGINFQTSAVFNSLPAGLHTFTILDAAFNTALLEVALAEPGTFAAGIGSKTDVSINGKSTGEVVLNASGGTPPYRYSKNGTAFQTSATFGALPAGSYTFTVRDAVSATAIVDAVISEPPVLVLSLTSQKNLTSYNSNTGEVVLKGTGGIEPYQYSKDGTTYQSSATITGLAAGVYTFTVKDAASATATIPATITQPVFDINSIKAMNNFTPNGDGVNDKWEIENITSFPEHTVTIFDRGGRVLLKEKNYKNDWEGTVNGSALKEGTYYYSITFDMPEIGMKKGFITIIR